MVDSDPWGKPYRLIMGKLGIRRPIPGINTPGRMDAIINGLFPVHARRPRIEWRNNEPIDVVTTAEVMKLAQAIPGNKAPRLDAIPGEAVKLAAETQPQRVTEVFNRCLKEGKFPAEWKRARLVLLRKNGKPLDEPNSYRPLCMLDAMGKFFEKLIDTRLKTIIEEWQMLTANQFGFRRGMSTLDAISRVMGKVNVGLGHRWMIGILTLDVQNAFNSAPWSTITETLRAKQVPGYICRLLDDYFNDKTLCYEERGTSATRQISAGVPQGSVLDPTLWNFLYDELLRLPTPDGVELVAYADDIVVIAQGSVTFKVGELLEEAAEIIVGWLSNIGIRLALEKSELLIPTLKKTHNTLDIRIRGHVVSSRPCVKYLGVHIDQKSTFKTHAHIVSKKVDDATRALRAIMPNTRGPR